MLNIKRHKRLSESVDSRYKYHFKNTSDDYMIIMFDDYNYKVLTIPKGKSYFNESLPSFKIKETYIYSECLNNRDITLFVGVVEELGWCFIAFDKLANNNNVFAYFIGEKNDAYLAFQEYKAEFGLKLEESKKTLRKSLREGIGDTKIATNLEGDVILWLDDCRAANHYKDPHYEFSLSEDSYETRSIRIDDKDCLKTVMKWVDWYDIDISKSEIKDIIDRYKTIRETKVSKLERVRESLDREEIKEILNDTKRRLKRKYPKYDIDWSEDRDGQFFVIANGEPFFYYVFEIDWGRGRNYHEVRMYSGDEDSVQNLGKEAFKDSIDLCGAICFLLERYL